MHVFLDVVLAAGSAGAVINALRLSRVHVTLRMNIDLRMRRITIKVPDFYI